MAQSADVDRSVPMLLDQHGGLKAMQAGFMFRPVLLLANGITIVTKSRNFAMDLGEVVSRLGKFAPLSLAAEWDNVGLLVEPTGPHVVKKILLTNDLTEPVLHEAVQKEANMVLSYHPPIFSPLKRLTSQSFKERIIVKAIEHKIAVYSPHTAFDAIQGGVNDWLASGLGEGDVEALQPSKEAVSMSKVSVSVPMEMHQAVGELRATVGAVPSVKSTSVEVIERQSNQKELSLGVTCTSKGLGQMLSTLQTLLPQVADLDVMPLEKKIIPATGFGRLVTLKTPVPLPELLQRIKDHLKLPHVRLAVGGYQGDTAKPESVQTPVQTVALCAGSGAGVMRGVHADVFLTGEMSHHEVLAAVSRGTHVILCEHSNTERGYLSVFSKKLEHMLEGRVEVCLSHTDADPLQIV